MKIKYINLTPHTINIFREEKPILSIEPSGQIARVSFIFDEVSEIDGVKFFGAKYGKIEGLSEEQKNTIQIVSEKVLEAALIENPLRSDIASLGRPIRNEEGIVIGFDGLRIV